MYALKIMALTFAATATLGISAIVSAAPQVDSQGNRVAENRPAVKRTPGKPEVSKTPKPEKSESETELNNSQVAAAIATHFGVSVDEVNKLHQDGLGYGEIARIYALAKLSGKTVDDLVALHKRGQGWGNIAKELGVSPKQVEDSIGKILQAEKEKQNEKPKIAGTPQAPGKSGENRQDADKGGDKGKGGKGK